MEVKDEKPEKTVGEHLYDKKQDFAEILITAVTEKTAEETNIPGMYNFNGERVTVSEQNPDSNPSDRVIKGVYIESLQKRTQEDISQLSVPEVRKICEEKKIKEYHFPTSRLVREKPSEHE